MTLMAPACVLLLADTPDESESARRVVERALEDFEPALGSIEFVPNAPMWDRSITEDPRRSSRRVYPFVAPERDGALPPRAFDATVLFVSARTSVSSQTRALVFELAHVQRGPLVLCITECAHPEGLADLVEIEARELFESCGLDGDALAVVRSAIDARSQPDDGVHELVAWLDEHASVCPDASELPFVGQIIASNVRGWSSLRKHQGRLALGAKVQILEGATAFDAAVLEAWDGVRAGRPAMGVGVINARIDHRMTIEDNWVVSQRSIAPRTSFDAALFDVERLIDGWFSSEVDLGWGAESIAARIELRERRAEGSALARIECATEVMIVDRASCPLWFDGERAGRAVVLPRL